MILNGATNQKTQVMRNKWGKKIVETIEKTTLGRIKENARGGKQGYSDRQDESLGMRTGKESSKKQSMKARRDDSYGAWGKRDRDRVYDRYKKVYASGDFSAETGELLAACRLIALWKTAEQEGVRPVGCGD